MHRYAISEAKGAGRSPSYCAHWGSLAPGLAVPMQRMAGSDGPNGPGDKGLRGAVQGKEDISSHGLISQLQDHCYVPFCCHIAPGGLGTRWHLGAFGLTWCRTVEKQISMLYATCLPT